jgi:hypothetical protein
VPLSDRQPGPLLVFCLLLSACVRAGFEPQSRHDGASDISASDIPRSDSTAASVCASWGATALFCEDMDSLQGQLPDSLLTVHGAAVVDTSRYYAGRGSLRVTTHDVAYAQSVVLLDSPPSTTPVSSGNLYLRGYYYFDELPLIPGWAILMESRAHDTPENKILIELDHQGLLYLNHAKGQEPASVSVPVGRWFCIELEVIVGSGGGGRFWLDGKLVAETKGLDTHQGVGHNFFRAGIIAASDTPALTFNVDDFLVTRTRVGCD